MAVDSWSHTWQPNATYENHIIHDNYQRFHVHHDQERPKSMANFISYLLSLGMYTTVPNPQEQTGPFTTRYQWKQLDYTFPSDYHRKLAIQSGQFIPESNLPLGIEVYQNRLFVTMPKWKSGIPVTLAVVPKNSKETSPLLAPYPSWKWHQSGDCLGMTSVFRIQADTCGRLWVLDSGQIDITTQPKQVCPPKILIFDLISDQLLYRYEIPQEFIKEDSLYSNIVVDIRENNCENAHAYLADVWRFGLVVFNLKTFNSWRITDHLFFPDPLASSYKLHELTFEWTDGIFSLALSPYDPKTRDRLLYFHPMSSFRECSVKTSVICNETGWSDQKDSFRVIGESRGKNGHASTAAMDANGIMFYNLVTRDSIGCWDSRKPYTKEHLGIVAKSGKTLVFPNDLKIDQELRPSVWVITNRLPYYMYDELDANEFNFRVMSSFVDEAVKGTICDPLVYYQNSFEKILDGDDCY